MTNKFRITRLDGIPFTGWLVRLYQGRLLLAAESFADSKYDSKEDALEAAVKWRDAKLNSLSKTHGLSLTNKAIHVNDSRNISGAVGVSLTTNNGRPLWRARVGRGSGKVFYIKTNGYKAAFKKACEYRFEKAGIVSNKKLKPPEPPLWLINWAILNKVSL